MDGKLAGSVTSDLPARFVVGGSGDAKRPSVKQADVKDLMIYRAGCVDEIAALESGTLLQAVRGLCVADDARFEVEAAEPRAEHDAGRRRRVAIALTDCRFTRPSFDHLAARPANSVRHSRHCSRTGDVTMRFISMIRGRTRGRCPAEQLMAT